MKIQDAIRLVRTTTGHEKAKAVKILARLYAAAGMQPAQKMAEEMAKM